jgi:glycerol-3-phosphate cytidylyltransferase-like family protein
MSYKHIIPTFDYAARKAILEACTFVDLVVCNFYGADSKPTIEIVEPDIIAIGADWSPQNGKDYMTQMGFTQEWLNERHIELRFIPLLTGHSSTSTRRKLQSVP